MRKTFQVGLQRNTDGYKDQRGESDHVFTVLNIVLVKVSIVVKRSHEHINTYYCKYLFGVSIELSRFISLSSRWKHYSIQEDMVLEKKLIVFHLGWQPAEKEGAIQPGLGF